MKTNFSTFTFLAMVLMIVLLTACGSAAPASSTPTESTPFPTGNFKAVNPLYAEEIRFFDNGIYGVVFRGESSIGYSGTYTITGDQLVFDDPDTDCAGHSGKYNWTFDGKTLTLSVIEDTCTALPRAEDLGHAWEKLP